MFILIVIWTVFLSVSALVLSVRRWRNAVATWLKIILVKAGILIEQFRKLLFWFAWILAIDHILLLIFILQDMHSAIIAWSVVNCLIYWLVVEFTRIKILKPFRQPIGYFFLIWALAGLVELAMPGILKNGAWWLFGFILVPLIIGQVYTLSNFASAGKIGLKVLLTWIIAISIIVTVNLFGDNYFNKLILDIEMMKTRSDRVTWAKVVLPTGVYKESKTSTGLFSSETKLIRDTTYMINVGDYVSIPISKKDFNAKGFPTIEYGRRVLVPIIRKRDDFFEPEKYWVLAQSLEQSDNPLYFANPETTKKDDAVQETEIKNSGPQKPNHLWTGVVGPEWNDTKLQAYNGQTLRIYGGDFLLSKIGDNVVTVPTETVDGETIGAIFCDGKNPFKETWKFKSTGEYTEISIYEIN